MQRSFVATASLIALTFVPSSAFAHAAPYVLKIAWRESSTSAALMTNRGIIFGDPTTHSWRLMCNEALNVNVTEQPEFAYVPDGRLIVASSAGLRATDDEGCTWRDVASFGTTLTPALTQDPSVPSTLYAGTYGPGLSAVRKSIDSGATWTELMPASDNDFIQEILIAPGKHDRMYVSGQVLDSMGNYTHYVARSDDAGASWERHPYALLEVDADLTLIAISPEDPDLILAIAPTSTPMLMTPDRLLVSRDGGETFAASGTTRGVLGGSFSADGSAAFIAGSEGLLRSDDGAKTFTLVTGTARMSCYFERDAMTFACGWYQADHDGVGVSDDDGASFAPWMTFKEVTEPVQCAADSPTASKCERLWHDWQREIFGILDAGMPMPVDGGTAATPDANVPTQPDAGTGGSQSDAGMRPASNTSSKGCGCAVHGGARANAGTLLLLLLALALGARVRHRRARASNTSARTAGSDDRTR